MAEEENGDDGDEKVGEVLLASLARGARRPEHNRHDGGGGGGSGGGVIVMELLWFQRE